MILSDLVLTVQTNIQDSSFTEDDIIARLNEAQLEVAGGLQYTLGSWVTPPLPGLLTIDTVDTATDAAYVAMPTNFQRNLQFVASSSGVEIDIAETFTSFVETYPLLDKIGTITECCEFGNNFYYQGIPSASEAVTIHYYKFPTDMANDNDEPDGIPKHLHRGLLVDQVCWKIFELLEDDTEEPGLNTKKYLELFLSAARKLELFIPYENRSLILR
jgi:hypothetical protein